MNLNLFLSPFCALFTFFSFLISLKQKDKNENGCDCPSQNHLFSLSIIVLPPILKIFSPSCSHNTERKHSSKENVDSFVTTKLTLSGLGGSCHSQPNQTTNLLCLTSQTAMGDEREEQPVSEATESLVDATQTCPQHRIETSLHHID